MDPKQTQNLIFLESKPKKDFSLLVNCEKMLTENEVLACINIYMYFHN